MRQKKTNNKKNIYKIKCYSYEFCFFSEKREKKTTNKKKIKINVILMSKKRIIARK